MEFLNKWFSDSKEAEWIKVDEQLPKDKPTFCVVYLEDPHPLIWLATFDFQHDEDGEEIPETGVFHLMDVDGIEEYSNVLIWFKIPNRPKEYKD